LVGQRANRGEAARQAKQSSAGEDTEAGRDLWVTEGSREKMEDPAYDDDVPTITRQ